MVALPKFKNLKLFEQAFIHRSYLNEVRGKGDFVSNERLEFLGDSILAFLTSQFLYVKFSTMPEGDLTNLRSFLVKTPTLANVARELGLGKYLKLSRGEEQAVGRANPSLLANAFEALVGAIFLDRGLEETRRFLTNVLFSKINEFISPEKIDKRTFEAFKDSKSLFQELVQTKRQITPAYRVIKTEGPAHKRVFTVGAYVSTKLWGEGWGNSKQEAEQQAAKVALENYRRKKDN